MRVKNFMTRDPACCLPQASLQEVAHLMIEKDCGAIPIVEDVELKIPVGIITDRDIAVETVAHGKNPLEMSAAEIMSFPPVTVTPDTTITRCLELMEENKIRRIIVVDEAGGCCGIVAGRDPRSFLMVVKSNCP